MLCLIVRLDCLKTITELRGIRFNISTGCLKQLSVSVQEDGETRVLKSTELLLLLLLLLLRCSACTLINTN